MLRKFKEVGKKKIAVVMMAAVLSLGVVGGTTYAYKDEFGVAVQNAIHKGALILFPSIGTTIDAYGKELAAKVPGEAKSIMTSYYNQLEKFKQDEINRGKASLDQYYQDNKDKITAAANAQLEAEKKAQREKTNQEINEGAAAIDAAIQVELDKLK